MPAPLPAAFDAWSDERYGRPGVADLLLRLQDDFDLSVNLMLWCGWCAESFADLPELSLKKAMDLTEIWSRDVTGALRHARRALKNPPRQADGEAAEALRQEVKTLELRAERVEQAMLAELARDTMTPFPDPAGALPRARRSLTRYAALAGAVRKPGFSTLHFEELAGRLCPYALPGEPLQA